MELCSASLVSFSLAHEGWRESNEACGSPSLRSGDPSVSSYKCARQAATRGCDSKSMHVRLAEDGHGRTAHFGLVPALRSRRMESKSGGIFCLSSRCGLKFHCDFPVPQKDLHLAGQCHYNPKSLSSRCRKFFRWTVLCQNRASRVALHTQILPTKVTRGSTRFEIPPHGISLPFSKGLRLLNRWKLRVGIGEDLPPDYQDDDPLKRLPQRRCGILLHPSSLPGAYGTGALGKEAFIFLDWLRGTGCKVWQVLPLVPPGRKAGEDGSPYAGNDANCGNMLLISLDELVKDGLLEKSNLPKTVPVKRMNSAAVAATKDPLIAKAAKKLVSSTGKLRSELQTFRESPLISAWLEEAALFAAIDQSVNVKFWWDWTPALRDRDPAALDAARHKHKDFIDSFIATQFLFQRQWQAIHKYANAAGIKILGDMPIYVGGHSADVWAHRSLFALDATTGAPLMVSGVPPDAFSSSGQLWGSPLYNWQEMAKDGYSWWATRLRRAFQLYDEFRIDHFRGLAGYWAIPATADTAMHGNWKAGPGMAFFTAIKEAVGKFDIVAEDLGIITGDVVTLRKSINAPGMAVLQFAFGSDPWNPHLPHNHEFEQVVYPGTHDNDTCLGWWKKASPKERESVKSYLRFQKEDEVHWEFIRGSVASIARTTIIPLQDVMGLDNSARMNIPATQAGNWGWRVGETGAFQRLEKEKNRLRELLFYFNRITRAA